MLACITLVLSSHLVHYLIISSFFFSLSVMEPTRLKPKACSRYALSQRKMLQCGCVVASTHVTHLTVMARTSRTSSFLPHCMHIQNSWKVRAVLEPAIHVSAASQPCTSVNLMKAAYYLVSHDNVLNLLSWHYFSHCLTETRVTMESFLSLNREGQVSLTTGLGDMMTYHLNCVYQWRLLCQTLLLS